MDSTPDSGLSHRYGHLRATPKLYGATRRPQGMASTMSPCFVELLAIAADVLAIIATSVAAAAIAEYLHGDTPYDAEANIYGPLIYQFTVCTTFILAIMGFRSAHVYETEAIKSADWQIQTIFIGWTAAFLFVVFLGSVIGTTRILKQSYPQALEIWYGTGLAVLLLNRRLLAWGLREWSAAGRLGRRTLLVGANSGGLNWLEHLRQSADMSHQIIGVVAENGDERTLPSRGMPLLGSLDQLVELVRAHRIDLVVIALPWSAEADIRSIVDRLRATTADVCLLPHQIVAETSKLSVHTVGGIPLLGVVHRPVSGWGAAAKRIEDLVIVTLALVLLAPLLLLTAAAIKMESAGPVLFRQKRFGFDNEEFQVWKFRTMYTDREDKSGAQRTVREDPRVTRVGRFLRRTSIDELPQLFNVLFGDMSIVGPRPHPVAMRAGDALYHEVVKDYACRHRVRPGITGWAQVNGCRGEVDTLDKGMRRVEYDLYYIDHWSLLLDLKIIVRTFTVCFHGQNAY